jgi:hypothetical protein
LNEFGLLMLRIQILGHYDRLEARHMYQPKRLIRNINSMGTPIQMAENTWMK